MIFKAIDTKAVDHYYGFFVMTKERAKDLQP